ncbi:MAG: GFA family protein, partial [Aestuariivirgaceae bacterium]
MTSRSAKCSCGQLTAVCEGEPVLASLCHCIECQRRTGSTYGVAAFFKHETVEITGRTTEFTRPSENGHPVTFHFCPNCGSSVFWRPSRLPELV